MITRPTVLILGAGASMPFGFPSGAELVNHICSKLIGHVRSSINDAFLELGLDHGIFDKFVKALYYSGRTSIDAFLQHNPDYMAVGKLAIAAALTPFEGTHGLFRRKDNWYLTLLQHLNANIGAFGENKLSVITYNYDRSLEWFLLTALKNSYPGTTYEQCYAQMNGIRIIHLHGCLGQIPPAESAVGDDCRRYASGTGWKDILTASQGIRVIHEDISADPVFAEAKELLRKAEVIAFLGFGFDTINLERLGVYELSLTDATTRPTKGESRKWYGTTLGLGDAKKDWVTGFLHDNIQTADADIDAAIRRFPILISPFDDFEYRKSKLAIRLRTVPSS